MLDKERFLAIKKLANKIRHDNENLFKKFDKELIEDAISEKEEFIENVIDSMGIEFDEGEQGREEKQIFRANILLPDDMDFFEAYSKDKNIRNLMNKYAVSIEDVMSKITELNICLVFFTVTCSSLCPLLEKPLTIFSVLTICPSSADKL